MNITKRETIGWGRAGFALIGILALSAAAAADTYEAFTEPIRTIDVSAADTGRIAQVYVRPGERLRRGDLLMVLDARILEAASRVAKAKANAMARLEAARVELKLKQDRYEQLAALLQDGAGSRQEVTRAEADAKVARLNVRATEEELELAKLQLAELEARIEQRRVRSPIDGVVIDVLKEVGEFVSTNEPHVATLVQLETLRTTFYLPTRIAMSLAPDQKVRLLLPELGRRVAGRVQYISEVTEADSGRVRVDVEIDNHARTLRSGVRCVIEISRQS